MNVSLPIPDWYLRRRIFLGVLFVVAIIGIFFSLLVPYLKRVNQPPILVGQVADQDYVASTALTYISDSLTEDQREKAIHSVEPVYTAIDTGVARSQLERLRAALDFIATVRADPYATPEQKMSDLAVLQDVPLDNATAQKILMLSDIRWTALSQEAIVVLEQVMRTMIRADRLAEAQRSVPALVSLSLPEDQAEIVADLVKAFVAPNSFYDANQTKAAVDQALAGVQPVTKTYMVGQIIVPRGKVIDQTDLEALQKFGLAQSAQNWQEVGSAGLLTAVLAMYFALFLRRNSSMISGIRSPLVFTILFLAFVWSARLIIPNHVLIPYLFPAAAFALTNSVLFGSEPALLASLPLAVVVSYQLQRPLELTLFMVLGSFFGVWTLQHARRLISFFLAGGVVSIASLAVITLYRLLDTAFDWPGFFSLGGAALINGMASAGISLILQFFLAQFLGMISPLQLIELIRPDSPLLQFILRNAPGTYQHSLQVANLAEQAAEKIGADTLLTRVGALYHDAGKALNPFYFIENQPPGELNPHDDIEPSVSAAQIIRHVTDGLELARRYHLPRRIQDFISEHHGTLITRYQYVRAVEKAGGNENLVNINLFRYPGPSPRSRETALLMLADGSEARVRAERPRDEQALRITIRKVIDDRLKTGELNGTNLTLRQLDMIVDSFTETLRGLYHPRIEYPNLASAEPANALPALNNQAFPLETPTSLTTDQPLPRLENEKEQENL